MNIVSVIIPVKNREVLILNCLTGLLLQTHKALEIIVVDNGSTDKTMDVVRKFSYEHPEANITLLSESTPGACAARNRGLGEVSGKYFTYLDSDDYLGPTKIEQQVSILEKSNADVTYGNLIYVNEKLEIERQIIPNTPIDEYLADLNSVQLSPLVRNNAEIRSVTWNEQLPNRQDIDYFFRVYLRSKKWVFDGGTETFYVRHNGTKISDSYASNVPFVELIESVHRQNDTSSRLTFEKRSLVNRYTQNIFNWACAKGMQREIKLQVVKYGFNRPFRWKNIKNSLSLLFS